ncbi:MAG: hypothetical protein EKK37_00615 [Sphingobacteriales bacterium]|nr:MAG: hypothetical protein EKK37_00615 [Sphingobacteriales bacterium]
MKKITILLVLVCLYNGIKAQTIAADKLKPARDTANKQRVRIGTSSVNKNANKSLTASQIKQTVNEKNTRALNPQPLPPISPDKNKSKSKSMAKKKKVI